MKPNNQLLLALMLLLTLPFASCSKEEEMPNPDPDSLPNTCLAGNEITISNIQNIPPGVTFNKLVVAISGYEWEDIRILEASYNEEKFVLTLPSEIPADRLSKVKRDDLYDFAAFWPAEKIDNNQAKVAGLRDFYVYDNDKKVGRVSLTDWTGTGPAEDKYFVYYHYASQPFTLSGYNLRRGNNRASYQYQASFKEGWNVYANVKAKESDSPGPDLCTTTIPGELPLVWRFEPCP